jgi:oxygen-independent coproporphyrinogen-3 oxidase
VADCIAHEAAIRKNDLAEKKIASLYFGGGTPSVLNETELKNIFSAIRNNYEPDEKAEITFEVNPDDINKQSLKLWKDCGINRLSIGLQSFNDEELKWMNRAHTAAQSTDCVKMAQDMGFDNITIDLIYGSKFQSLQSWEQTLKLAIDLNVPHISSYNLTIEEKTALGVKHKQGEEQAVDDDLSSRQFLMMSEMLEEAGFIHYEISNFGKKDFFAVHNSNYWLGHYYIGLGPSAHSYNGRERQWNVRSNQLYMQRILSGERFYETETLTPENKYNEYVLTRLRTIWGCNVNEMEKLFGKKFSDHFLQEISAKKNFIIEKNGVFTLNKEGKLLADGIASDLFA